MADINEQNRQDGFMTDEELAKALGVEPLKDDPIKEPIPIGAVPDATDEDLEWLKQNAQQGGMDNGMLDLASPYQKLGKYDKNMPYGANQTTWRAEHQPWTHQAANSFVQGIGGGLLTAIEDASYILDVESHLGLLQGEEDAGSNWIADLAKQGKEALREDIAPIYRRDPGSIIDMGDSGFYWGAFASLLDSAVGFGVTGLGVGTGVKALGKWAGKGLAGLARTRGAAQAVRQARLGKYLEGISPYLEGLGARGQQFTSAMITNYGEGKMMAMETYEETLAELKASNPEMSEEQMRTIAGEAADDMLAWNRAFIFTDALALGNIMRGFGSTRREARQLGAKAFRDSFKKLSVDNPLVQAVGESVEEIGQNVIQKEAKFQAKDRAGVVFDYGIPTTMQERLWSFATSEQALLEGVMGFLGGPIQYGIIQGPGDLMNKDRINEDYTKQQEQIKRNNAYVENKLQEQINRGIALRQATNQGESAAAEYIREDSFIDLAYENFERGTTDKLERTLEGAVSDKQAEIKAAKDANENTAMLEEELAELNQFQKRMITMENQFLGLRAKYSNPVFQPRLKEIFRLSRHQELANKHLEEVDNKISARKEKLLSDLARERGDAINADDIDIHVATKERDELNTLIEEHEAMKQEIQKRNSTIKMLEDKGLEPPHKKTPTNTITRQINKMKAQRDQLEGKIKVHQDNLAAIDRKQATIESNEFDGDHELSRDLKERAIIRSFKDSVTSQLANATSLEQAKKDFELAKKLMKEKAEADKAQRKKDAAKAKREKRAGKKIAKKQTEKESGEENTDPTVAGKSTDGKKEDGAKKTEETGTGVVTDPKKPPKVYKPNENPSQVTVDGIGDNGKKAMVKIFYKKDTVDRVIMMQGLNAAMLPIEGTIKRGEEEKIWEQIADKFTPEEAAESGDGQDGGSAKPGTGATNPKNPANVSTTNTTNTEKPLEINRIAKDLDKEASETITDENGQTVHLDNKLLLWGHNKISYVSRPFQRNGDQITDEGNELSQELRDPLMLAIGFYTEGTKVTLEVDRDYDDGTNTYASLVEKGADKEGNQKYDHIPIAIKNENGKIIGYLADTDSIPNRVVGENVEDDLEMLRIAREAIVKQGVYQSKIEHKSQGHLAFTAGKKPMSVAEAFKDPNVSIGVKTSKGIQYFNGKSPAGEYVGHDLNSGHLYAFVPKTKDSYFAIPLMSTRLDTRPEIVTSIVEAIRLHLTQNLTTEAFKAAEKAGFNLSTAKGLENYVRLFMDTAHLEKGEYLRDKMETVENENDSFIHITPNGIDIAIGGNKLYMTAMLDEDQNMVFRSGLGEDSVLIDSEEFYQGVADVVALSYFHASLDPAQQGQTPFETGKIKYPLITETGDAKIVETAYDTFLKGVHTTNVVQFDLGDGNYTVFQQPNITVTVPTEVPGPVEDVEVKTEPKKKGSPTTVESKAREILDSIDEGGVPAFITNALRSVAKGLDIPILGSDTPNAVIEKIRAKLEGTTVEDAPIQTKPKPEPKKYGDDELGTSFVTGAVAAEPEKGDISDPIIQEAIDEYARFRVDGITALQQHELVSSFAFGVLNQLVAKQGKKLSYGQIIAEIKANLEAQERNVRADGNDEVADKVANIISDKNWPKIAEAIKSRLKRINGIKISEGNTNDDHQEANESLDIEGYNEKTDYDKTNIELNPHDTLSGRLKLFLSGINQVDRRRPDGKKRASYLMVELFEAHDEVYAALQAILAGAAPKYSEVIARLKSARDRNVQPYLAQVVDKLEAAGEQVQNEFATEMTKGAVKMKYVIQDGQSMKVVDSNRTAEGRTLMDMWMSNLRANDDMFQTEDGDVRYTAEDVEQIEKDFNTVKQHVKNRLGPENKDYQEWLDTAVRLYDQYLSHFGIELEPLALEESVTHNGIWTQRIKPKTGALVILLERAQQSAKTGQSIEEVSLFEDNAIRRMASHNAIFRNDVHAHSFYNGKNKMIYGYAYNKYMNDRFRLLLDPQQSLLENLKEMAYNKNARWAKLLESDPDMQEVFDMFLVDAYKSEGRQKGKETGELTDPELSVLELALFTNNGRMRNKGTKRIVHMLYPNTGKKNLTALTTVGVDTAMNSEENLADDMVDILFEEMVKPDMDRIHAFTNVNVDNPQMQGGKGLFYFVPELNHEGGSTLVQELYDEDGVLLPMADLETEVASNGKTHIQNIKDIVASHFQSKLNDLIAKWEEHGIIQTSSNGKKYLKNVDGSYLTHAKNMSAASGEKLMKYVAMDFLMNSLVANTNIFKLFAGDPALFWTKGADVQAQVRNTFDNIGKRLAGDDAPGRPRVLNPVKRNIIYGIVDDRKARSLNEELAKKHKEYAAIKGADSQEWTTLEEHLDVLVSQGMIPREQAERWLRLEDKKQLSKQDLSQIFELTKALQPQKPVYRWNYRRADDGLTERAVYIKSSSIPLIKQLTEGLEIDKVRQKMIQGRVDRVASRSAWKLGALISQDGDTSTSQLWDENGDVRDDFEFDATNTLALPLEGFRIQQDIPYNPNKSRIKDATQQRKLLLVDLLQHPEMSEIAKRYMDNYTQLFEAKAEYLLNTLSPKNEETGVRELNVSVVQKKLHEEAIARGYPNNDIALLALPEAEFIAQLPFSNSRTRVESLLNSIVQNKVLENKVPGAGHVLVSEDGWKLNKEMLDDEAALQKFLDSPGNGIVFTDNYKGELKPAKLEDRMVEEEQFEEVNRMERVKALVAKGGHKKSVKVDVAYKDNNKPAKGMKAKTLFGALKSGEATGISTQYKEFDTLAEGDVIRVEGPSEAAFYKIVQKREASETTPEEFAKVQGLDVENVRANWRRASAEETGEAVRGIGYEDHVQLILEPAETEFTETFAGGAFQINTEGGDQNMVLEELAAEFNLNISAYHHRETPSNLANTIRLSEGQETAASNALEQAALSLPNKSIPEGDKGRLVRAHIRASHRVVMESSEIIMTGRFNGDHLEDQGAWTAQMAIDQGKKVSLYDNLTDKWYVTYYTPADGFVGWRELDELPKLKPNTGIVLAFGNTNKGRDAIKAAIRNTFVEKRSLGKKAVPQKRVRPAQVIVPWNFRDHNGNVIPMEQFMNDDGRIDMTRIPAELLRSFAYRIPTSNQSSMAEVEIVGFLPMEQNMVIATRDFVAQMGSDFDVDKLYMNFFNFETYTDTDGQVKMRRYQHSEAEIEKKWAAEKARLDEERENDASVNTIWDKEDAILQSKIKRLQDEQHEIHLEVMSRPETYDLMTNPIGYGQLEELAAEIDSKLNSAGVFSPATSMYQRDRYLSGRQAKAGVGVFSLVTTFMSTVQMSGKPMYFATKNENTGRLHEIRFRFGEQYGTRMDNPLGHGGVRKSQVAAYFQNAALDDEKIGALSKLNINNSTYPVINALIVSGFDERTISAFINQPIVRDYVTALNKYQGTFVEDADNNGAAKLAYAEVVEKYNSPEFEQTLQESNEDYMLLNMARQISSDTMMDQINTESDIETQRALLEYFVHIKRFGDDLRTATTAINSDSKGIPKFYSHSVLKEEDARKLGQLKIYNAPALLGDFFENIEEADEGLELTSFNPRTINGLAYKFGLHINNQLWRTILPYDNDFFNEVVSRIEHTSGLRNRGHDARGALRHQISLEVASYMSSALTENVQQLRGRLTKDTKTNKSLASIVKMLKEQSKLADNAFFRLLKHHVTKKNDGLSLVYIENASARRITEEHIHAGFMSLLEENRPLGTFNGKEYTTNDLAMDLAMYDILSGNHDARSFSRYVPFPLRRRLLERAVGKDNTLWHDSERMKPEAFLMQYYQHKPYHAKRITASNSGMFVASDNEEIGKAKVLMVDPEALEGNEKWQNELVSMDEKDKGGPMKYFSVRRIVNKKPQWSLYVFDGSNAEGEYIYKQIPVLGTFGMSEYVRTVGDSPIQSLMEKNNRRAFQELENPNSTLPNSTDSTNPVIKTESTTPKRPRQSAVYDALPAFPKATRLLEHVTGITGVPAYEYFANYLLDGFRDVMNQVTIVNDDETSKDETDKDALFKVTEDGKVSITFYRKAMHQRRYSREDVMRVIFHELFHVVTWEQLEDVMKKRETDSTMKKLYAELEEIMKYVKPKMFAAIDDLEDEALKSRLRQLEGETAIHEFAVEILTDKAVQKILNKIQLPKSLKRRANTSDDIKDGVVKLISASLEGDAYDPNSALTRAMEIALQVTYTKRQEIGKKASGHAFETGAVAPIEADPYARTGPPKGVDKIIADRQQRVKEIQGTIAQIRGVKGSILRVQELESRIRVLNREIKNLRNRKTLKKIDLFAARDLDRVRQIVAKGDDMRPEHFFEAERIVNLWKKSMDVLFTQEEREDPDNELVAKLEEYKNTAERLEGRLSEGRDKLMNKYMESVGVKKGIDQILQESKDVDWLHAQTLDISRFDNAMFQVISKFVWDADMHFKNELAEFEEEFNGIAEKAIKKLKERGYKGDRLYDLFRQKDERGRYTGWTVSPFTPEYYWMRTKLANEAKKEGGEAWTKYYDFIRKNNLTFDFRRLFKIDEVFESEEDRAYNHTFLSAAMKEGDQAHRDEIREIIGDAEYEKMMGQAAEALENYKSDYEHAKEMITEEIKDEEERNKLIRKWVKENSPYWYGERVIDGDNTKVRGALKDVKKTENDYVPSIARTDEYADENFKEIASDEDLLRFYDYYTRQMRHVRQILPDHAVEHMSQNSVAYLKKSVGDLIVNSGSLTAGIGVIMDAANKMIAQNERESAFVSTDPITGEAVTGFNIKIPSDKAAVDDIVDKMRLAHIADNGQEPTLAERREMIAVARDKVAHDKRFDLEAALKYSVMMGLSYKHKARVEPAVKLASRIMSNAAEVQRTADGRNVIDRATKKLMYKDNVGAFAMQRRALDQFMRHFYGIPQEHEGSWGKWLTTEEKQERKEMEDLLDKLRKQYLDGELAHEEYEKAKARVEQRLENLGQTIKPTKFVKAAMKMVQLKGMGWNFFSAWNNINFGVIANWVTAADRRFYTQKELAAGYGLTLHSIGRNASFNMITTDTAKKIRSLVRKFNLDDLTHEYQRNSVGKKGWFPQRLMPLAMMSSSEYLNYAPLMVAMLKHHKMEDGSEAWEHYDANGKWIHETEAEPDIAAKIVSVKNMNHGNYHASATILADRSVWGQMFMQFRRWIGEAFAQRFEAEKDDAILGVKRKGRYNTGVGFISFTGTEDMGWAQATLFTLGQLGRKLMFADTTFDEAGFSEVDAANLRKNLQELVILLGIVGTTLMLKMAVNPDDEQQKAIIYTLLNTLSRLQMDVTFYANPFEMETLIRRPIPIASLITDTYSFMDASVKLILGQDEIKSGIYAGHSRWMREAGQLMPLTTQFYRAYSASKMIY